MSMYGHTCDYYADQLAELALGALSGRERAETLAHVDNCSRCFAEVEELSRAADELLHVAPETEPPLGFEVRLLERLGVNPALTPAMARRHQRREALARHSRTVLLGAAAAVLAIVGTVVGLAATSGSPTRPPAVAAPRPVQATLLDAHGHDVGAVIESAPGTPPWVFMYLEVGKLTADVNCELVLADGHVLKLGTFWVDKGYGTWSAPIDVAVDQVRGARLVSASGALLASATFTA